MVKCLRDPLDSTFAALADATRREVLAAMTLISESPFVDAELCLRAARGGFRVGEVDVEHHPRQFGRHSWTWWPTLQGTVHDVLSFRRAST